MSMLACQKSKNTPAPQRMPQLKPTPWDALCSLLVLGAAIFLLWYPAADHGNTCIVQWDGGETAFPLSEDGEITVSGGGYTLKVVIADGYASVTSSDCPDGVCVHSDAISRSGEIIVCVPAGVVVRIPADSGQEDFRVG